MNGEKMKKMFFGLVTAVFVAGFFSNSVFSTEASAQSFYSYEVCPKGKTARNSSASESVLGSSCTLSSPRIRQVARDVEERAGASCRGGLSSCVIRPRAQYKYYTANCSNCRSGYTAICRISATAAWCE